MTTKHSATHLVSSMFFLYLHKCLDEPPLNNNTTLSFYLKKIDLQSPTRTSLIILLFVLVFSFLKENCKSQIFVTDFFWSINEACIVFLFVSDIRLRDVISINYMSNWMWIIFLQNLQHIHSFAWLKFLIEDRFLCYT